jgi:protein-disulfide isomerase
MRLLSIALLLLVTISAGMHAPAKAMQTPLKAVQFWDMGLQLGYPEAWPVPQFLTGQLFLAPASDPTLHVAKQPFIAVRIVDPMNEFGLPKDATLEAVAQMVAVNTGVPTQIESSNASSFAGVEAWSMQISAEVKISDAETVALLGQVVTFLLPDGRHGAFIANAPREQWGDFFIVQNEIANAAVLLLPENFPAPVVGTARITFPQGGVQFPIPDGWAEQIEQGVDARTYFEAGQQPYRDSGLVNGAQLQVLALPFPSGGNLKDALMAFLQDPRLPVTERSIGAAGGATITAAETFSVNQINWQTYTFVAFLSQDGKVMNIFRWTTPGMLISRTRPTFDAILGAVTLGPVTTALGGAGTISSLPITVPSAPPLPDYAALAGFSVSATPDGAPLIGDPAATVRVVEYLDFACPSCAAYSLTMRQFLASTVREGKASLELRYLTMIGGDLSVVASHAALCAGEQGKLVEAHEMIFTLYLTQGSGAFTVDSLVAQAAAIPGLNAEALRSCIQSGKYVPLLQANRAAAAQAGVVATPTVLVGRAATPAELRPVPIDLSVEVLQAAVDGLR